MKFYIIFFLSTLTVAVKAGLTKEEGHQAFRALAQGCKTESGAMDADIEAVILHQPANSKESKCMRACLMKKFNLMNPNGKFVKETAMQIADFYTQGDPVKMQVADEVTEICKDIAVSDDHCEASEQYGLCVLTEAGKRGIKSLEF